MYRQYSDYVFIVRNLIKPYLANWKQFVYINGFDSELRDLLCGVLLWTTSVYLNNARSARFGDDTYITFDSEKVNTIETVKFQNG